MNNFEETLKSAKLFRQTILGGSSKSLEDLFDFQETTIFQKQCIPIEVTG